MHAVFGVWAKKGNTSPPTHAHALRLAARTLAHKRVYVCRVRVGRWSPPL